MSNDRNEDSKIMEKENDKTFNINAFHQLQVERCESQLRAEQERSLRRRLHWDSTVGISMEDHHSNSQRQCPTRSVSFEGVSSSETDKLLARRELFRLGRRYASRKNSSVSSITANTHEARDQHVKSGELSSPSNTTTLESYRQHSTQSTERRDIIPDPPSIRPASSSPLKTLLLLARGGSPPQDATLTSSPAPHLEAASPCNSHGENEEEDHNSCDEEQGDDHFSSFCKAQVFISEIEHKSISSRTQHEKLTSCTSCEDGNIQDINREPHKPWVMELIVQYMLTTIAVAAVFVAWLYIMRWYKFICSEWSLKEILLALHLRCVDILRWSCWSAETMQNIYNSRLMDLQSQTVLFWDHVTCRLIHNAKLLCGAPARMIWITPRLVHSTIVYRLEQISSQWEYATSRLMLVFTATYEHWQSIISDGLKEIETIAFSVTLLMKSLVNIPITAYTSWRKDFDMLAWTVDSMYCIVKKYYDALELLSEAKDKAIEVRQASILAWNMTLSSVIAFWQQLKSEQPQVGSQDNNIIRRSTLTMPLIFKPSNVTLSLPTKEDTAKIDVSVPPQYLRGISRGTPFVIRRNIHNGHHLEAEQNFNFTSPSLNVWQQNGLSYPLVLLRHPRLSLDSSGLDSDTIRTKAPSLAMQSKPPQQQPTKQPTKTKKKGDYYSSSFPTQGGSSNSSHDDLDIFNEVDVMSMAREFVSKLWQQRRKNN